MDAAPILQAGSPQELYFHPKSAMIATLLGDAIILPADLSNGWAHCVLGRIAVDDDARSGRAEIMIRPEQISLTLSARETCGRVVEVEFAGGSFVVSLSIGGEDEERINVRHPSLYPIAPGVDVGIDVVGRAHIFVGDPGV